jgi:hypothetical protein
MTSKSIDDRKKAEKSRMQAFKRQANFGRLPKSERELLVKQHEEDLANSLFRDAQPEDPSNGAS